MKDEIGILEFISAVKQIVSIITDRGEQIKIPQDSAFKGKGYRYLFSKTPYHIVNSKTGEKKKFLHGKIIFEELYGEPLYLECHWSNKQKGGLIRNLAGKYKIDINDIDFDEDVDKEENIEEEVDALIKKEIMNRTPTTMPISMVRDLYVTGKLHFPKFQRKQVWKQRQAEFLIDTIIRNYPIPRLYISSYLKKEQTNYNVLDGQQRLLAILQYLGKAPESLYNKFRVGKKYKGRSLHDSIAGKTYSELDDNVKDIILEYELAFDKIIKASVELEKEMYYRVNTSVEKLNAQEIRRGEFEGIFRDEVEALSEQCKAFFATEKIISTTGFNRMMDHELVAFLLSLIIKGLNDGIKDSDVIDECYMAYKSVNIDRYSKIFISVMDTIKGIKTDTITLGSTIFRRKAQFICLFKVILDLTTSKYRFSDISKERIAKTLKQISIEINKEVDMIEDKDILNFKVKSRGATANYNTRIFKIEYLISHIKPFTIELDIQRIFNEIQKQFIYHRDKGKCQECNKVLSYDDWHCDHVVPWSKGGRTTLDNGQILCSKCNQKKGNKIL